MRVNEGYIRCLLNARVDVFNSSSTTATFQRLAFSTPYETLIRLELRLMVRETS